MHNRKRRLQLYCAKILILLSFGLFTYGFILDLKGSHKLIDHVTGVSSSNGQSVSITPVDGSEVVTDSSTKNGNNKGEATSNLPIGNVVNNNPSNGGHSNNSNVSNNNGNNNQTNNSGKNNQTNNNSGSTSNYNVSPPPPTIEETNNSFRRQIENTYGVTVKYGSETNGYSVDGIATTPIYDSNKITSALNELNYSLSLYPNGLFTEIKNGGIPLTILLVSNYSDMSITGVTDSDYSSATISIATIYPFGESFYHESYHYIERYMFKRGANFLTWNYLNPEGFAYGIIRNDYSYANTFAESAPFVNNYAQTDAAEDRASTFEYMMAASKASCLNYGTTVWQKASLMAENMDAVLNTVRPDVREYWERYLY